MRKALSVLLCLALIIGFGVAGGFSSTLCLKAAATEIVDGVLTYEIKDGEAAVIHCDKSVSGKITIPAAFKGYPVTKIGQYAFQDCTNLTGITIPDTVTLIEWYAFYNTAYYNTTSNWENNVLYIGHHLIDAKDNISGEYEVKPGTVCIACNAFEYCDGLTGLTVPGSVQSINNSAFNACRGLTYVVISDGVKEIGKYAFNGCSKLTELIIPDSVTSIGTQAFSYCSGLTSVTIGEGVTTIEVYAFTECTGLETISLPSSVSEISPGAFSQCPDLTVTVAPGNPYYYTAGNCLIEKETKILIQGFNSSVIPANGSVEIIGQAAFSGCTGLTSVNIPDSVKSIDAFAFEGCSNLTDISIPDSVETIGYEAFWESGYYNSASNWNSKVLYIDNHLIEAKSDLSGNYTIKEGTVGIAQSAFSSCSSLKKIYMPAGVKFVGISAFQFAGLEEVYYGGDVADRTDISIGLYNNPLIYAFWYYNCTGIGNVGITTEYVLTYNANGGSGAPQAQTGIGSITLSSVKPSKSGYTFLGWSENSASTIAHYQPGGTFNLSSNTVLYAVWQSNESPDTPPVGGSPAVNIKNFRSSRSEAYKTTITFTAVTTNAPSGSSVHWIINGNDEGTGDTYIVKQATSTYTIQTRLVGSNGSLLAESGVETVSINSGFFARLIAFFRQLFGSLPITSQSVKE